MLRTTDSMVASGVTTLNWVGSVFFLVKSLVQEKISPAIAMSIIEDFRVMLGCLKSYFQIEAVNSVRERASGLDALRIAGIIGRLRIDALGRMFQQGPEIPADEGYPQPFHRRPSE